MVRLFNVYYPTRTLLLACGEALIICSSFLLAGLIRFGNTFSLVLNELDGYSKIALACGVILVCLYYHDLYDSVILSNRREVFTRLIQVLGITCLVMAVFFYILPTARMEIGFFLLGITLMGFWLAGWRQLFFVVNASSQLARRAIILGTGPLVPSLAAEIEKRPEWGVRVLGYVGQPPACVSSMNGLRNLGGVDDLPALVERERVSQVIIAMGERRGCFPIDLLLQVKSRGVLIQNGADIFETLTGKVPLDSFQPSRLLFSPSSGISRATLVYKRITSIVFSALGLVLSLPLMALIAVAIRLDSEGPILFRQPRVGKEGKIFNLYKFRSMRVGADPEGDHKPAQRNDDRFTRVGRWLRRTRLDEIPQLYNILRGDMYFVGPRPFVPNQENELSQKIPFYGHRWTVKPGATGWAQVNQGYCATLEDNLNKLAYDLFYVKNMSIGLDLLIVFRTLKVLVLGRGSR